MLIGIVDDSSACKGKSVIHHLVNTYQNDRPLATMFGFSGPQCSMLTSRESLCDAQLLMLCNRHTAFPVSLHEPVDSRSPCDHPIPTRRLNSLARRVRATDPKLCPEFEAVVVVVPHMSQTRRRYDAVTHDNQERELIECLNTVVTINTSREEN